MEESDSVEEWEEFCIHKHRADYNMWLYVDIDDLSNNLYLADWIFNGI